MSLTIGQKCVRVLYLLRGLGNPRAVGPLIPYGFSAEVRKEGWTLLMAASDTRLAGSPHRPPDPGTFARLDEWENRWFPIARATLRRHYPEVGEAIFVNLTQTSGLEVAVSVATFVRRVRTAQRGGTQEDQAAMRLLADRGLNEAELDQAEALLARFETTPEPLPAEPEPTDTAAAEQAMWDWYLEWSTVARQAITDRNVLRSLGFLRPSRADGDVEEDGTDDELEPEPALPASALPAAGEPVGE